MRLSSSLGFTQIDASPFATSGNVVGIEVESDGVTWTLYFNSKRQVESAMYRDWNGHVVWINADTPVPPAVIERARAKLNDFDKPSG